MSPVATGVAGAHQRLLPEAIPLRFFGTAIIAHGFAWAGVAIAADEVSFYQGGPGLVVAVVHTVTLGVLLCTAMGATLQILPVALCRPAPGGRLSNAIYALLLAGAACLIAGFATNSVWLAVAGAAVTLAAATAFAVALGVMVKGASELNSVRRPVLAATACLFLAVTAAGVLAIDNSQVILADHQGLAISHMVLAIYGFMGMLVLGFSPILVPMFAIAETRGEALSAWALVLALFALSLAVIALLGGWPPLVATAAVIGLAAAGCHVVDMERILAKRIRKRLGAEFLLIRLSWVMLPIGLALGVALALDWLPSLNTPALFGFVVVFGWLLSLVFGVLQRIIPFLASMHATRAGARPLPPTKLVNELALRIHRHCHVLALAVVAGGILLTNGVAIRLGACIGLAGAIAYAAFAAGVFNRTRRHVRDALVPSKGVVR